jgi:trehalose/maltose hydrolase-like predicted phosphorylase
LYTSDVNGPDEFHLKVNNSDFVNIVAKITLEAAANLTNGNIRNSLDNYTSSSTAENKYQYYADRILVNFDAKSQYHPEYDGYKIGKGYC